MVTHDSDAVPGLSNRIAARWARFHAVAMPARYYRYPARSVRVVGVPIDQQFEKSSQIPLTKLRRELKIASDATVVMVTGGSNGARRLNAAVIAALPELLDSYINVQVIFQYGKGNEDQFKVLHEAYRRRIIEFAFSAELHKYTAAADIVVTRAGATTLSDLAAQKKACILVPHPQLAGGHQLKNAEVYQEHDAAVVVSEKQLQNTYRPLLDALTELIDHPARREALGNHLNKTLPKLPAAKALANVVLEAADV